MKVLIFFFAILVSAVVPGDAWRSFWNGRHKGGNIGDPSKVSQVEQPTIEATQDHWFTQVFDHFNPRDSQVWQQRYFVNTQFWNGTGPVFVLIGDNAAINPKWMYEGAWVTYARDVGALLFQLEHRFYGKSRPTLDLGLTGLLVVEHALADLSRFVIGMNEKYKLKDKKWIAFGGSYSGSLAAWARHRYQHLIHGAISSSAPLLAKIDFTEYFDVVRASLASYSENCVTAVKNSFDEVHDVVTSERGWLQIATKFRGCSMQDAPTNNLEIAHLFSVLAGNIARIVQYNKDNSPLSKLTIDGLCNVMVSESIGTPLDRFAKVNEMVMEQEKESCLNYKYQKMIDEMRNTSWDAETSEGGRQWAYQTCTELGFFQTSEATDTLFGNHFNVTFFQQQCQDIFGEEYSAKGLEKGVMRVNIEYGALDPKTTNVIYVHGSIDPWHTQGITQSVSESSPAVYIEGTAHCADMYEPRDEDLPQLKEARTKILQFIKKILQNDI